MIRTIKKEDFTSKTMREMKVGDSLLVIHSNFKSMESTMVQISNFKKRNEVQNIKAERDSSTFVVEVTMVKPA